MGAVEALYIFNEHNTPIFEHIYTGRPPSATILLPLYLAHPAPRPSLIHLPNTKPPTLLYNILQDRLLFVSATSADVEPLLVLEFLHRVADVLQDFLGSPLLASKLENSYDVVAQIVGEMCDAGTVCNTEPNALKEIIDASSWMGNLLGGFGLPASSPALASRTTPTLHRPESSFSASSSTSITTSSNGSTIPWRRSNVRHTSNELYVDIIETLSVILAPSGRPLSATANGTVAFTSKMSGVPDLLLTLSAPGGKSGIQHAMDLPCFHPCVRLARWRDHPGELSFVPPDGRFVLAGYECDLLPDMFTSSGKLQTPNLNLPASVEVRTSLGPYGDEFEVRLTSAANPGASSTARQSSNASARTNVASAALRSTNSSSSPSGLALANVVVTIPIPSTVRNITDLRSTKGEAHHLPAEGTVEWRLSTKEASTLGTAGATLRCALVGPADAANSIEPDEAAADPDTADSYHSTGNGGNAISAEARAARRVRQNAAAMPRSASLSFSANGWLASGIRVESLSVNAKTSKGLGAGVTPYKGVKYHTVSEGGVEVRC